MKVSKVKNKSEIDFEYEIRCLKERMNELREELKQRDGKIQ